MFILLSTLRAMETLENNYFYVFTYLANKADSEIVCFCFDLSMDPTV